MGRSSHILRIENSHTQLRLSLMGNRQKLLLKQWGFRVRQFHSLFGSCHSRRSAIGLLRTIRPALRLKYGMI
jgi:hypothetical protein